MKEPHANGSGLTVGQTARLANVGIPTMRFYERAGLLPDATRSAGNYRLYPDETVTRIIFIRRSQVLGFTLKEIRELLELRVSPRKTSPSDTEAQLISVLESHLDKQDVALLKETLPRTLAPLPGEN